jgi:hypothetical protein
MGCLGFFLFFFVAIIFAATVLSDTPERNRVQGGLVFSVWGVGIVGALVGRWISRDNKNRPKRLEIEDHSEKINECIRTVPGHDGLGRCV